MNAPPSAAMASRPPLGAKRRPDRLTRNLRGFTIIEVALAAFVMLFAIVSALTTLQASFQAIDNARYATLAGQILQSQMEKLRLLTWAQLTDPTYGPGNYPNFTPDISASTAGQLSRFTSFTQTISDAPSPFNATMKDITLTVTWTDSFGSSHSLSYLTRYGQNGISDFFYTTH